MKTNLKRRLLERNCFKWKALCSERLEPRVLLDADPILSFAAFAAEDLKLEPNSTVVLGAVGSDGKVGINKGSKLNDIFAGGEIKIESDVFVSGNARSNDKIKVEEKSYVAGNVDAGEQVKLQDLVEVGGNVTSAEQVKLGQSVYVAGTVTEFGSPERYIPIALPPAAFIPELSDNDIDRAEGQTTTLSPGIYGELKLADDNALYLSSGEYFFERMDIAKNLQLTLDVSGGGVSVFVEDKVKFDRNLDISLIGGDASDVYLEVHGAFHLKEDGEWFGTVFAPFGDIDIEANSTVVGAVYAGQKIKVKHNTQLTLIPSDYLGGGADELAPELSVGLLNDTGIAHDSVSFDPSISGTVIDEGIVASLTLTIPELSNDVYELAATVGPSGTFSLDRTELESLVGGPLEDGHYTFTFAATDDSGNATLPVAVALLLDTTIPTPVISQIADDTGIHDTDGITADNNLVFFGTAEAGSTVTLIEPSLGILSTATANAAGVWAADASSTTLADGIYSFSVTSEDLAANASSSSPMVIEIDSVAPGQPHIVGVADDTGASDSDGITNDATPSLYGLAEPNSLIRLSEQFIGEIGATTSDAAGAWSIGVSSMFFSTGPLVFSIKAMDTAGNISPESTAFQLTVDTLAPLAPEFDLTSDSDTLPLGDLATSLAEVTLAGITDPGAEVELVDVGMTATANGDGGFQFLDVPLSLGANAFRVVATDLAGNQSAFDRTITRIEVHGTPPTELADLSFGLDPASDTGDVGDGITTLEIVSLTGLALPEASVLLVETGDTSIVSADGIFGFSGIDLEYGRQTFTVEATDAAGNVARSTIEITFDFSVSLSETSLLVTEASFPVNLSQDEGTRSIRFDLATSFDTTDNSSVVEDTLLVYLVDANDPTSTVLDRGTPGTSLFALTGEANADYPAGLVNFDGTTVRIDVTSLGEFSEARVLLQLISTDTDSGTTAVLSRISNTVDAEDVENPVFHTQRFVDDPAAEMDLSSLSVATNVAFSVGNIRWDAQTGRYSAELSLRNQGPDFGRQVAVVFSGLPSGVTLSNASGFDGSGSPYVNMSAAIPPGGLATGDSSYPVLLEFDDPGLAKFALSPTVLVSGPNSAPIIDPVSPIVLFPGDYFETQLTASDADGDVVTFSIGTDVALPTGTLSGNGRLVLTPTPEEIGVYGFDVVATDGPTESRVPVTVSVQADPITSTRVSGTVLTTTSQPLAGVPIELGSDQTTTLSDGTFLLELTGPLDPNQALLVRGEAIAGAVVYPFIAEKLPLLIGHEGYENVNNVIQRPIYLPALDVASGSTIDPLLDVTVSTPAIPGAAVFVAAGTLDDQSGNPFTGVLSITEVPVDLTPAALPPDMFPDLVVTIQPGEMVFTSPAPLTLPNRMGLISGTLLELMSINPETGLFDNVGLGLVSPDGELIETISGGINNSSWHFFSAAGPTPNNPEQEPRNQDKNCDDKCESRDSPDADIPPIDEPSIDKPPRSNPPSDIPARPPRPPHVDPNNGDFDPPAPTDIGPAPDPIPGTSGSGSEGGQRGPGNDRMTFKSDMFDPPRQPGPARGNATESNVAPKTSENARETGAAWIRAIDGTRTSISAETEVALHSGAVYKSHALAPYESLRVWRELELRYDSERADPRPIIHTSFSNVASSLPDVDLISKLAIKRGNFTYQVPGYPGDPTGRLTGGEHFFKVPDGATTLNVSLQVDMRSQPSGLYTYESTNRFGLAEFAGQSGGTAATVASDDFVHVNTIDSPFGAGWGLSGLLEIVENPDGSVLMLDGAGGENLFKAPSVPGAAFVAPPGDFTTLELLADGTYRRTHPNQTVQEFNANRQLALSRDRNGNETQFLYNALGIERIVDPVGLETSFRYTDGVVSEIEDPAGRVTRLTHASGNLVEIEDPDSSRRQFAYDNQHRLRSEIDKNGNADRIEYDFAGRAETILRKDGSRVDYAPVQTQGLQRPETSSQPISLPTAPILPATAAAAVADPNGNVTSHVLDKQGQLRDATDGSGRLPSVERNAENLVHVSTDGRGYVTLYEYDDLGNVTSISDPVSRGGSAAPLFAGVIHAVGNNPIQVITADINADGFADAAVANYYGDSVSILLGNGAGGFGFRTNYPVNDPRSLTLADLNRDSFADLVTGNRDGQVSVLLANGDGTFGPATSFPAGSEINFIEAVDLNADGLLDVVAADYAGDSVVTLLGSGDGVLGPASAYSIGTRPGALAVGDFNDDGSVDVVATNALSSSLSVLLGNGDGSFGTSSLLPLNRAASSLKVADVTRDGKLDVVATNGGVDVSVLAGVGDGTFAPAAVYLLVGATGSIGFPPYNSALDVADVDGDQDLDLLIAEGIDVVTVLLNDGRGEFDISDSIAALSGTVSVSAADLNLDGAADMVALGNSSRSIIGVIGNGDGTFVPPPLNQPDIAIGDRPIAFDLVDVNGDGHLDAVTANQNDASVSVLLGDGDGGLSQVGAYPAGPATLYAGGGDLDGDGDLDLVTTNYSTDSLSVLLGDGSGSFSAPANLPAGSGPVELALGDLDQDGDLDVVSAGNRNSISQFSVLLNHGDATFAPAVNTNVGFLASSPDLADINGDGFLDLAVANAASSFANRVNIRLGNGDGTFQDGVEWVIGGNGFFPGPPTQVKLADVTGDGLIDLVATDKSDDKVVVRAGLGDGSFAEITALAVGDAPSSLDAGDVDGDGVADLIVANQTTSSVTVWFGKGDGTFYNRTDFRVGSGPSWVRFADLNEDGRLDFVTTNRDSDSLTVRLNTGKFSSRMARLSDYDPTFSQRTRTIDEEGRLVLFEIDPTNGNTLSVTQVIGELGGGDDVVTEFIYTPEGLVDLMIDPLGRVTDSDYDAWGRLTRITYAVGTDDEAFEEFEYDVAGNLTAAIDELGHRTEFEYDAMNRLTKTIEADPDGPGPLSSPITTFAYDTHGNLTLVTDALERTRTYAYDAQHRVLEDIDDDGAKTVYAYDQSGNVTAVTDRLGRKTSYVYDDRNRKIERHNALGGREDTFYDSDNNVVRIVDENRNPISFTFDARNRLIRTVNAIGGVNSFEYDRVDNLVIMQDELFRRTEMVYDELDRNISFQLPDPDEAGPDTSPIMQFTFDAASNLISTVDALGNRTSMTYDQRDRLVSHAAADPDGDSGPLLSPLTEFTYDDANRLISVSDPLSRVTTYAYDDLNRLVEETYPDPDGAGGPDLAPVITREYDAEDFETSMTDPLGHVTQYVYDNLYRLVRVIEADPDGPGPDSNPETNFIYDAEHQLLSITDPLDRVTTNEYDALGHLTRQIHPDPDGAGGPEPSPIMTYTYDNVGNRTSMVDALGNVTRYDFDDIYRTIRIIEADPDGGGGPEINRSTQYEFDLAHQVLATIDPLGRRTQFEYDRLGRVVRETYPDPDGTAGPGASPVMAYEYDLMNNKRAQVDALGNMTDYTYDNLYRLTAIVEPDPDGGAGPQSRPTTSFIYDSASQMTSTTDPLGRQTTYELDGLGRVVREIGPDPDGPGPLTTPVVAHAYDLMNNKLAMTDAVGNVTQYEYDSLYRLVRLIEADPDGAGPLTNPETRYVYDIANQLLSESDPLDRTTTYQYDDLGRVVRVTQPDPDGAGPLEAPESSYVYDLMNNELAMTDPLGRVTQYEYDNLYRVIRQVEEDLDGAGPLGTPTTEFTYDLVDNLLSLTDAVGNRTDYVYDDLDRVLTETIELAPGNFVSRQSVYDLADNLVQRTDRNGRSTEFKYDHLHRLVEENWLDNAVTVINSIQFEFDEASQLLRAEDVTGGSRYDYVYDDLSRVTQTAVDNGGSLVTFANAYDAQSRRTQQIAAVASVPDYVNSYSYDGLNRLARLDQVDQGGNVVAEKRFDFDYNGDDQLTLVSRFSAVAGAVNDLVFDSVYGYDGIGRLVDLAHTSTVSTLVDYEWTFDVASRITQVHSSVDGTSDYDYDQGDQLTGAVHASQSDETYGYDENGNRTSTGYATGVYNRLNSDGTFNYEYDAEGNRTRRTQIATGAVTDYQWDHRNRLVNVVERASVGGPATRSVVHRYDVYNRWISKQVDGDGDGPAGAEVTRYEYDGNQIVLQLDDSGSVAHRYVWGPIADQVLADEQVGGEVYWPATDHLGTIRDVLDSGGQVANHVVYDSFGNVTGESDAAVDVLFGFTGRAFDESTGLQNNLNRWYDAVVGRWISEDPIGMADDANPFRYVRNRPISAIDPIGLAELTAGKIRETLPYAELAANAYTSAGMKKGQMIGEYRVRDVIEDRGGFRAVWFENAVDGEGVLAFAGTETPSLDEGIVDLVLSSARASAHALLGHSGEEIPRDLFSTWGDWLTDTHQGGGGINIQYEMAIRQSRLLKGQYGNNLTLTGHSLGGGLASAAAMANGIRAKVFNPAGVHPNTLRHHGRDFSKANELIEVFRLWADPLTSLQDRLFLMPDTAGTVYEIPTTDNGLMYWLNNHGMSRLTDMLRQLLRDGQAPGTPRLSQDRPSGGGGSKSC